VVNHAGTRLLADVAEVTGLSAALSEALMSLRQRNSGHDPSRVALDVAVMLADGGEAIADLAVLRNQPGLFGRVASDPTAWRVLDGIDDDALKRGTRGVGTGAGDRLGPGRGDRPLAVLDGGRARERGSGARHGRHHSHLPLRQGEVGQNVEEELRLPPSTVLPRRDRGSLGRRAQGG
jgi:Transposase DDE domain group 1